MSEIYDVVTGDIIDKPFRKIQTHTMQEMLEDDNSIIADDVQGDMNIIINAVGEFKKTIKDTFESKDITDFWLEHMEMLLELYKNSFEVNVYNISDGLTGYSYSKVKELPYE